MQKPFNVVHYLKLSVLFVLLYGGYWIFTSLDLEKIFQPAQLVEYLAGLGPMGPLVFILMMTIAVVVSPIPSLPLDLAAGAAYGPFLGTTYAVLGAEIGAILSFLIARVLGREVISRLLKVDVVFCQKCSDHHLTGLVFLSRLLPVFSFDLVSYGAGLTNMTVKSFAVASLFGMIPPTFALTYFGSSVVTVQWPFLVSGTILVVFFMYLPKWIVRKKSSKWVRFLQGEAPEPKSPVIPISRPTKEAPSNCPFCGGEM